MTVARARRAAWALGLAAVVLTGCATRPTAPTEPKAVAEAAPVTAPAHPGVKVTVLAPDNLRVLLERYLDVVRLGRIARNEADDSEWSRLIDAAPAQARDLLQTEGYFRPQVSLQRLREGVPVDSGAADEVQVRVDPGPQARIDKLTLLVEGDIERAAAQGDQQSRNLINALQQRWPLFEGSPFRNAAWGAAKGTTLAQLRAGGYASARWSGTQAEVDADGERVRLFLVADSGPLYRLGDLVIEGLLRHDAETVRNLAGADAGAPLTDALLYEYQERLQKTGLFEGSTVVLDSESADPARSKVLVRVREAPLQTLTPGLGISANTGPRASVEYINRRVLGFAATTRHKAEYGDARKVWEGEISEHTGRDLYRNLVGGAVEQLKSDTDIVLTQRLRLGRTKDGQRIERFLFVEADRSVRKTLEEVVRTQAVATSLAFHGVWRDLDSVVAPTQGFSLKGQLSTGYARGTDAKPGPFSRVYLRLTGYQPLSRNWFAQARVEVGQVILKSDQIVPETQQFRAGGDDSVRGYAYRSLGPLVDGAVGSGNALYTLSGEVARPLLASVPALWGAVFFDAGNAGERFSGLKPALGAGVGLRYRSPVGPLRLDWAYGREVRRSRIHFSVGIAF